MKGYFIIYFIIVFSTFSYDIKEHDRLILNLDAKYYLKDEIKAYSGLGMFSNEFSHYFGYFKDGVKNGYGQQESLGEMYIGEFKNGLFHGKGALKSQNGIIFEGIWEKNKFKKKIKTGFKLEYLNGRIYESNSFNNIFNIGN